MQYWTRVMCLYHINSEYDGYTQIWFKYKCTCNRLETLLVICKCFLVVSQEIYCVQIGLAVQLDYFKAPMTFQDLHPTSLRNSLVATACVRGVFLFLTLELYFFTIPYTFIYDFPVRFTFLYRHKDIFCVSDLSTGRQLRSSHAILINSYSYNNQMCYVTMTYVQY